MNIHCENFNQKSGSRICGTKVEKITEEEIFDQMHCS